jgi:hypothetical protein
VALLLGYLLLFPPLLVLGPLAGLLAASRPTTLREWAWVSAAGLWLSMSLLSPGGLATQILSAWALFLTGAFVVLMLGRSRGLVSGALLAALGSLGATTAWVWGLGTRWQEIQLAVAHMGWEARRELLAQVQLDPARLASARIMLDALAEGVGLMAHLFPGLLILMSLPGLALAWAWYHRLAVRPVGPTPEPFAEFRFNDQLIWLVVVSLAVVVLPVPGPIRELMGNIGAVIGGLYAARGAAIVWGSIESFPLLILAVIGVGVLLILPVALGGAFAIGLADTWVDFRRRFRPADTEGRSPWK